MNLCNLRELRKERGLTQVQLAEMMSVTQGAVSSWESGTALPQASQLPRLADLLGCSIDALYGRQSTA